ncbi:ankyrin repeat, PH and SEC7 domain containing protein secG-like [Schistocerca americana]|uniref:ankyrin repeat, PH and SEC7 domain containing protein secG-like n=1 Tax=Schistocerca americana TaxID=7009 RepID=UPI001F4F2138|nr:ankyrin repeat, PH and SEC7 domain containing protein secG-like [Schistocerca americana]
MSCRSCSWFICFFVAVVLAAGSSDTDSITESDPEVTVYSSENDNQELSTVEPACEQLAAAQLSVETAAATAVSAMRHSCTGLTRAAVAFISARFLRVMATEGWVDAARSYPSTFVELVRLLAEAQADTRSLRGEAKDKRLIQAAKEGAVEELLMLLKDKADLGATDENNKTALHWAAAGGHTVAVRCLLMAGADVGARDNSLQTPLHEAALNGHAALVQLLVASSADPNARDEDGWTPLHSAAFTGQAEAVTALLEAGANKRAVDNIGKTPQDIARQYNHQQLIDVLS